MCPRSSNTGTVWDDPWCGTCLARLAERAASDLTIFGLGGFGREEQEQGTAARWDAKARSDVGAMILSYIEGNHAPAGSKCIGDLQDWAERLERRAMQALIDLAGGEA